jgi:hypothetical protein
MSVKTMNQQVTGCDAPDCTAFYAGERPKSWKRVIVDVQTLNPEAGPAADIDYDACSVKHAKLIIAGFVEID